MKAETKTVTERPFECEEGKVREITFNGYVLILSSVRFLKTTHYGIFIFRQYECNISRKHHVVASSSLKQVSARSGSALVSSGWKNADIDYDGLDDNVTPIAFIVYVPKSSQAKTESPK